MNVLTPVFFPKSRIFSKDKFKKFGSDRQFQSKGTESAKFFIRMFDKPNLHGESKTQGIVATSSHDNVFQFEEILDTLFILGEQLKKSCNSSKLCEYKCAVKHFFSLILEHVYECVQNRGTVNPRTCLQREYLLIKVIDSRLDSLVKAVLKNQAEVLVILEKVDEIKGLIIDYFC